MSSIRGTVQLRPTRIGFVVNPVDHAAIRKVMRYCACLWGGRFNPIIPLSRQLPASWREKPLRQRLSGTQLAERYIRFFEPDVFVDATGYAGKTLGYDGDTLGISGPRIVSLSDFVTKSEDSFGPFVFGQDVFDLYKHLYQTEFKFVQHRKQPFATFEASSPSGGTPFCEAVFGMFPNNKELSHIIKAYNDIFFPKSFKTSHAAFKEVLRNIATPLGVTNYGLQVDYEDNWNPLIFVFDPLKGPDLLDYWNLRIFSKDVVPINIHWFKESADYIRERITKNFRPLPRNLHGVMIDTTVEFASSISEDRAKDITQTYLRDLPDGSFSTKSWYTPLWDISKEDWHANAVKATVTASSKDVELTVDDKNLLSWLQLLSPDFSARFGQKARWANVLHISSLGSESELAICFPLKNGFPTSLSCPPVTLLQFHARV